MRDSVAMIQQGVFQGYTQITIKVAEEDGAFTGNFRPLTWRGAWLCADARPAIADARIESWCVFARGDDRKARLWAGERVQE